ncbi:MAG: efflux RND transporter permease subunit [Planctomycetota bacterium]|jgi:HAE1 family hydrophobic/amphiphilic exporter-1
MFSKFFIYRPIFAAVVSIVILILGGVALVTLPISRYPLITPPTIEVSATYPGANAVTIGETVATPIEQEVNGVEDMAYMTSVSSADGTMNLTVTFNVGTDLDMANVLVQNRVSTSEAKLPEEVRRQGVSVKKKSPEITLFVAFYSPDESLDSSFLHNFVKLNIEDEVKRVPGVGDVLTFGTGEYGMRVWLDPNLLKARGLTTSDVVNAIREQNVEVAAGQIGAPPAPAGQAFQYTVNTTGRFTDAEQFEDIIVKVGDDGQLVYVKDVARVELGSQMYDFDAGFNGQPTAAMGVYQLPGANAIEVADGVAATLARLMQTFEIVYGDSLAYEISYDNTDVVRASIKEVIVTLFITLALVIFTVYVFLQNFRSTLIPVLTIPVSLIGTFAAMAALGFSINQLTLFGLVLVIGIVVDDAIVVVENTTRLIEDEGMESKEAAVQSMNEVTGPVVATTLVLLAVFVPTVFMGGIIGQLFRQFAVTISIATVFSSINALTLSPALCGILLKRRGEPRGIFRLFNRALDASTVGLTAIVRRAIRVVVLGLMLFAGLVVVSVYGFTLLPTGFVPQEDEGYAIVNVQLPDGASLERTIEVVHRIDELIESIPGLEGRLGISGFSLIDNAAGSNLASFFLTFEHWDERPGADLSQETIVRQINQRVAQIQEAIVLGFEPPSLPGVGMAGGFSLALQDRGGAGLGTLEQVANDFVRDGSSQAMIAGMLSGFRANNPQLYVEIDREQVRRMDVPLADVFGTLQAYLGSAYVNDFVQFGRIYQVKAQADAHYRASPQDIRRLEVRNRNGDMVPLGTIVNIREVLGPQIVNHHNIYPSAKINGFTTPGVSSGQGMNLIRQMTRQKLPPTMGFEWTDLSYQEDRASGQTSVIFLFSIILVYLVLAAQYESWSLPMSVCLAVPTALLGAVAAVMLRQIDNNVYTQIGVVLLIGLSTKTAILIVEFAKVQREEGKTIADAAIEATRLRFRAVLMTAFSFILGVIPLLVATGAGGASRQALGTTVFGGMLVATFVSVVTVPMLYFVIQWISEKLGGRGVTAATAADAAEAGAI